ncbi:hypothetical protein N7527_003644 [Penicillium freii]|nr:hypothetical protein N7527_003644 [Penicillium freii]
MPAWRDPPVLVVLEHGGRELAEYSFVSLTLIVWFGVSLENETPCVSGRELPTNLACRPE